MKNDLSELTIEDVLDGNGELVKDFDKLSARKQKEIIFDTVLATYKQLADTLDFKHKAEEARKRLKAKIKQNPDSIKLVQLSKQIKDNKYEEIALMERYNGMKKLAEALGFDKKLLSQIST